MELVLAPDVLVNGSVTLGSPPERVVQRTLGQGRAAVKLTPWVMERVEAMLTALPEFKNDAIPAILDTIRQHVEIVDDPEQHSAQEWERALRAAAKLAKSKRVITDHPDLLEQENTEVEFISTEAWLLEQTMPPPVPSE